MGSQLSTDDVARQAECNINTLFSHFSQSDVLGSLDVSHGTITLPLGSFLGRRRFGGSRAMVALVNSGMGAPPVVVGLGVALVGYLFGDLVVRLLS